MPTALITGTNRGVGLELVRQYAADSWKVIATCRDPEHADALNSIEGGVSIEPLDVRDHDAIQALAAKYGDTNVDLLLLNHGANWQRKGALETIDYDSWVEELKTNTIAPAVFATYFADHLARSNQKKFVALTSQAGSLTNNTGGGNYAYRSSKAGLNAVMRGLSADLAEREITVIVTVPGHTQTDMGGPNAPRTVDVSARDLRTLFDGLSFEDTGKFLLFNGKELPW